MATFRVLLHSANKRKDGSYPVSLRIIKNMKPKYISLGLYAKKEEWDEKGERFRNDKRVCPKYKEYNARIVQLLARAQAVELDFERDRIDWTLNQYADAFLYKSKQGKFLDFVETCIKEMKETGHIGNSKVWEKVICNMKLFDKKLSARYFQEIDIKYVTAYNQFMEKKGWCGNTRKHDMKTLRAMLNRAIKSKECSDNFYPFGKGGFCISALEEETRKRYLPQEYLDKLMNTKFENKPKEVARRLFLFSYFCYGMSFIDMANLQKSNIRIEGGNVHIIYKRHKTEHSKNAQFIRIPMTDELRLLLQWFKENTLLVGDYLLPFISKDYSGEKLYDHLRRRLARYNERLKEVGKELGFSEKLTSYVSRHSMAMTLQSSGVPREMIGQVMGHKDLGTTNAYLDSFGDAEVERMTMNSLYKNRINL
ncbi:site-specific integrase [Phocaeicola sp.]